MTAFSNYKALCLTGSAAIALATLAAGGTAFAQDRAAGSPAAISVPAEPLASALQRIQSQSGVRVVYDPDVVRGRQSKAVRRAGDARAAVVAAIRGMPLAVRVDADGSITVFDAVASEPGDVVVIAARDEAETSYNVNKATSSTRTGGTLRDIPQNTAVISDKLIRDQQAQSVLDAIRNASGVAPTLGVGQGPASFLVRGSNATTLTNGLSTPSAVAAPVAGVERIEVIRGPVAILSGAGNFGGTVNVVPKKPTATPLLNVALEYQTYDDKKVTVDASNAITSDKSLSARVIGQYEKAERAPGGYYGRSERLFSPSLRYKTAAVDVTAGINMSEVFAPRPQSTIYNNVTKRPRTDVASPLGVKGQGARIDSTRYYVDSSFTPAPWLTLVARGERYKVDQTFRYQFLFGAPNAAGNTTAGDSYEGQKLSGTAGDAYARLKFATGPVKHTLVAGVNFADGRTISRSANFRSFALNVFVPGPDTPPNPLAETPNNIINSNTTSLYAQDLIEVGPVHLVGALRRAKFKSALTNPRSPAFNNSQDATSTLPSFGAVLDVTKSVSLYGNFLKGYSPTTILDCAGNRAPDLQSRNIEGGVKAELFGNALSIVGSAFDIRTNVRFDYSTPATCPFPRANVISGGQVNRGIELTATGSPIRYVNLNASYSYQKVTYRNPALSPNFPEFSQVIVPGVSRHSYSLFLAYERPTQDTLTVGGALGVYGNSKSFADNGATKPIPGGTQIDANAFVNFGRSRLNVGVRNVFDKLLYSPTTVDFAIPVREGRRVIVTLSHAFY